MFDNIKYKLPVYIIYLLMFIIVVGLPVSGYLFYKSHTYSSEFLQISSFKYPVNIGDACVTDKLNEGAGVFKEKTAKKFPFTVKTPSNYQPNYAHPILIVFAPSGVPSTLVEKFTGLTKEATEAGFIIVYADSRPMSIESMVELGTIPEVVAEKWCIDSGRIFFTGHSDGGTISSALTFLPDSPVKPAAIAPSAAGVRGQDLEAYACPAPVSVMVMHGKEDGHFPGFGQSAAKWWAECNQCQTKQPTANLQGCVIYTDCLEDVEVRYCEGEGSHLDWPRINKELITFFKGVNKN